MDGQNFDKDVLMTEARLARMEAKIDKMAEVLSDIKALDEKILSLAQRVNRHEYRLDHMEEQNNEQESSIVDLEARMSLVTKVIWGVVTALAGVLYEVLSSRFLGG